jgi:hypothetical protein
MERSTDAMKNVFRVKMADLCVKLSEWLPNDPESKSLRQEGVRMYRVSSDCASIPCTEYVKCLEEALADEALA